MNTALTAMAALRRGMPESSHLAAHGIFGPDLGTVSAFKAAFPLQLPTWRCARRLLAASPAGTPRLHPASWLQRSDQQHATAAGQQCAQALRVLLHAQFTTFATDILRPMQNLPGLYEHSCRDNMVDTGAGYVVQRGGPLRRSAVS